MAERKTIRKWFWVWDFDKEEQWFNEMAAEGWALVGVGFCKYIFERCEPNEYIVRLEMRTPQDDYISFVESTGAEYIGRFAEWLFFRRRSELGAFELHSDIDSQIEHLGRINKTTVAIGIVNAAIGIINSVNVGRWGWINLLCAALLFYASGRIKGRMDMLTKERLLREN
ncbi:MAG: DUF2812 domain-containing protein [Firmicutes bacterium]|nr:DUF2812 domain-containing protein [Bacillota bacterium]